MDIKESDISEVLEPLHGCLSQVLALEAKGKGQSIVYTDTDVTAAALMYAHILSNRLVHYLGDEKAPIRIAQDLALNYGGLINELTLSMTGVDTSKFIKRRER